MANTDTTDPIEPKHMTFSNSRVPVIGCLIDYVDIGFNYLWRSKSFTRFVKLQSSACRASLSPTFLALVCFALGFIANVKFEVVKFDETPLNYDLHFMLMSKNNNIYVDDIDPSRVMWCFEASDCVALLISCFLIWNSSNVASPLSEYLFLPWLGVTVRGLVLRQLPTAAALVYTMAVIDSQHVSLLFLTGFSFLFYMSRCMPVLLGELQSPTKETNDLEKESEKLMEARICLEIVREVRARWERREFAGNDRTRFQVETLWSNEEDDVRSVEMRNFVY